VVERAFWAALRKLKERSGGGKDGTENIATAELNNPAIGT
jgi:hypothetical protein